MDAAPKKARGGARAGAGRRKDPKRLVDGNVARRIKAQVRAEETYVSLIRIEQKKLGIGEDGKLPPNYELPKTHSTLALASLLEYLDDRDQGRTMQNVNHLHDKPLEVHATVSIRSKLEAGVQRAKQLR